MLPDTEALLVSTLLFLDRAGTPIEVTQMLSYPPSPSTATAHQAGKKDV